MHTPHDLERRIRRVVTHHLGIEADDLAGPTSLSDDLAIDSLDRLELVIALEDEFDIRIPEHTIDAVRTYADLVAVICSHARASADRRPLGVPVHAHVQRGDGALHRAAMLTPYLVETIAEDVIGAGALARLELTLEPGATHAEAAWVAGQFAFLEHRGIPVTVRRGPGGPRVAPQAATRLGHG